MRKAGARRAARRDAAFAAVLALVLGAGVLGVLLLNTAMQQQAHRLAVQRDRIAALAVQAQTLRLAVDRAADPRRLDRTARALRLRPARHVRYLLADGTVSGRSPAAGRARAG